MELHRATGGRDDDFVSPIPGVPWSVEPSTSSPSGAQTPAGGKGVGSPKLAGRKLSGVKPTGGGGMGSPKVGHGLSLGLPTTPLPSGSEPSTAHTSPVSSPRALVDAAAAQAQLIDERISAALLRLLMATNHATLVASKTPTPPETLLTTRAEAKRVVALETKLHEAVELQDLVILPMFEWQWNCIGPLEAGMMISSHQSPVCLGR